MPEYRQRRQCTAKAKRTQVRCLRWAIKGGTVCPTHGGSIRRVKAAAKVRLLEREAAGVVARLDAAPVENPLFELKKLAGRALAWEKVFTDKLDQIKEWRYESDSGEQLRAEVAVIERAMALCAKVLVDIAKLNLDERLVRLEESRAALVEQVMLAVFADLQLTPAQIRDGRSSLGRRLLAITG